MQSTIVVVLMLDCKTLAFFKAATLCFVLLCSTALPIVCMVLVTTKGQS